MNKIKFTEEQINAVCASRRPERRPPICISQATLYRKAKYGGMEVSDAKRLRSLEAGNRELKKLLAESMLYQAALKEL